MFFWNSVKLLAGANGSMSVSFPTYRDFGEALKSVGVDTSDYYHGDE